MTVARTRSRFISTSYLLEVQIETYKVQLRTSGKVDQLYCWYQSTRMRKYGTKGNKESKSQRRTSLKRKVPIQGPFIYYTPSI